MESYKKLHKYYTEGKFRPFLEALSREIQQAPADFQFQLLKLQLPSMVEHVLEQVTRLLSADASLDTTLCIFLRCYQRELKEDIVLRCVGTTRFIGALFGLASCRDSTTRLRRYTMHVLTTVIESKAVKKVFMESLVRGDYRGGHGVKQALHQLLASLLESPGAGMSYDVQESTLEMAVYTYRALIKEERKGEASELVRHLPSALRDTFKRLTIKNFSEQSRHILNAINAKHSYVASFAVEAVSLQPVKPSGGTSSSAVRKLGRVDWIDFGAEELQFTIFDDDNETRTLISVPHESLRGVQLDEPTRLLAFTHGEDDHTWDIGETFKLPAGVYPRFRFTLRFDNETFKRLSNVVNKRIKASRMLAVPVRDTASQASRAGSQSERAGVRCSVATMMVMAPPASVAVPGSHPTVGSHKPHRSLTHLLRDESQDGSAPLGLLAIKPASSLPHDHTRKPLRSVSHGGGNSKGNTRPSPRPHAPPPDAPTPPQPQPAEATTYEHRRHSQQQQQHEAPEPEQETLEKGKPQSKQLHQEAPEATRVEQQQQQPQQEIEPSTERKEQLEMELSNRADAKPRRKQMNESQIEPVRLQAPPPSPADSFSLAQPDEPPEPREHLHDREDGVGEEGHGHEEMMAVDSQHTQTCPLSPKPRGQALQTSDDAEQQQDAGQKPPRPQQGDDQHCMPPPAPRPPSPGLSSLDRMALEEFDAQPPEAPPAQPVEPPPSLPPRVDNTRKSRNQRKAESPEVRPAKNRGKSKVPPRATATAQQPQRKAQADKGKRRGRSSHTAMAASQQGATDRAAAAPAKAAGDKPKPAPATSAAAATATSACGPTPVPSRVGHATKAVIERPGQTTIETDVPACSRTARETPTKPSAPLPFKKSSMPLPSGHKEAAPPQTARPTRVVKASDPKPLRSPASTRNKGQKQEKTEHDAPKTRRGAGRAQQQEEQDAGEEVERLGAALVAAAGGEAVAANDDMEEQDGGYVGSPIESSQSAERRHVELFATIQSLIKEENRRRKTLKHQQETAAAVCADYKDKHKMVMQELDKADACIESGLSTLMEIQRFLKRTRAEIEDMSALLGPLENRDNGSSVAPAAKRRKQQRSERR